MQTRSRLWGWGFRGRYESDPEAAVRSGTSSIAYGERVSRNDSSFGSEWIRGFSQRWRCAVNASLHVDVHARDQVVRAVLKKDGAVVREIVGDHLDLDDAAAGVYRVEVFLVAHPLLRADVPWILSNPIFVGREAAPAGRLTAIRAQLAQRAEWYKR